jgi:hypothetical protein
VYVLLLHLYKSLLVCMRFFYIYIYIYIHTESERGDKRETEKLHISPKNLGPSSKC